MLRLALLQRDAWFEEISRTAQEVVIHRAVTGSPHHDAGSIIDKAAQRARLILTGSSDQVIAALEEELHTAGSIRGDRFTALTSTLSVIGDGRGRTRAGDFPSWGQLQAGPAHEPMTFTEWLAAVDHCLLKKIGRTHDQLDDWPVYDEYTRGSTAEDVAHRMIEDYAIDYEPQEFATTLQPVKAVTFEPSDHHKPDAN